MTVTYKIIVSGRVQGVGFRAFVRQHADRLQLAGTVRNCKDGTVEAVITGSEDVVQILIDLCQKGPPASRVEKVAVTPAEAFTGIGFAQL